MRERTNHNIRVPEVRLIDVDGTMIGVVKTHEALKMAEDRQVDLVEISPNANPPVAKLLDYDKYRYQQDKLARQSKKNAKKITVKEVRLSVRIGEHDLTFKAKQASEFILEGNKVKVDVQMRGREQAHPQLAFELMEKFLSTIEPPHIKESGPSRMGGTISVIIAPKASNQ